MPGPGLAAGEVRSEQEFASLVAALGAGPLARERLTDLLRDEHPIYDQRGAATIVQMRGWILLALARLGVSDDDLPLVLEELDTGVDAYLVAAAARALRSYPTPDVRLTPFLMRALTQIQFHDEPVSFDGYGEYATYSTGTSPVRELLVTLAWLGPHARKALPELEAIARSGSLSKKAASEARRSLDAIRAGEPAEAEACCALPFNFLSGFPRAPHSRRNAEPIGSVVFEDHDGAPVTFKDFFRGQPSIVVFFYTRCDNPLKCSLTIAKLARVQNLLGARGVDGQVRTAAITYDPAFDLPKRLRRYGEDRGVRLDAGHRMLRAPDGMNGLREHFALGVTFIESLVSRHRVEAYVLDRDGRVAASFERLHWDEQAVVDRAIAVMNERGRETPRPESALRGTSAVPGALAALGLAFFPKCLACWAAYLSVFGIVGLSEVPYSPWLQALLAIAMLVNTASVWLRGWSTQRTLAPGLVTAGAFMILLGRTSAGWETATAWGVVLTLTGSFLSAAGPRRRLSYPSS